MKRLTLLLCLLAACACKSKSDTGPGKGSGTGSGTEVGNKEDCEPLREHLDELYRADATATTSKGSNEEDAKKAEALVEEITADNVTMAISDCMSAPARVAACAAKSKSVSELEERCLIPLDEEGTEGDRFKGGK